MELTPVRYKNITSDSDRWNGFAFRDGDIIISTPPKCGTTWTQTICALLIFKTPDLPKPVDILSPWLDQTLRPLDSVVSDLEGQQHRRFIKTHTPFDGIPYDERVTYICVGRDPRDCAMSWDNHMNNLDLAKFLELRGKAVGNDDLAELMKDFKPPAETELARFWDWVDDPTPVNETLAGLASTLHHLSTFWRERHRPNLVFLHYGDLKADLEGQMRALAERLGESIPADAWPSLVKAATFEEMKSKAAAAAPNSSEPIWLDTTRFFHKGTNGQWRDVLDDDAMKRYAERVAQVAEPDLAEWAHQGPIGG